MAGSRACWAPKSSQKHWHPLELIDPLAADDWLEVEDRLDPDESDRDDAPDEGADESPLGPADEAARLDPPLDPVLDPHNTYRMDPGPADPPDGRDPDEVADRDDPLGPADSDCEDPRELLDDVGGQR